jgi:hypothetical protein
MTLDEWESHATQHSLALGLAMTVAMLLAPSGAYMLVAMLWTVYIGAWTVWYHSFDGFLNGKKALMITALGLSMFPPAGAAYFLDWRDGVIGCHNACDNKQGDLVDGHCVCYDYIKVYRGTPK